MGQKRSYKQYPKEFKEEAAALELKQGCSVAEAAKSLVVATILYRWKEKHGETAASKGIIDDDPAEIQRLHKEKNMLLLTTF